MVMTSIRLFLLARFVIGFKYLRYRGMRTMFMFIGPHLLYVWLCGACFYKLWGSVIRIFYSGCVENAFLYSGCT